jgi:hypothetical protein
MKTVLKAIVAVLALGAAALASCPYSYTCPLDGATCYRTTGTDWSNGHELATFEHKTIGGQIHRFTVACN